MRIKLLMKVFAISMTAKSQRHFLLPSLLSDERFIQKHHQMSQTYILQATCILQQNK